VTGTIGGFRLGEKGFLRFGPGSRVQRIRPGQGEQAEAVVVRPAAAGGIDDVEGAVLLKRLGSLVDRGTAMPLPFVFGDRDAGSFAADGERIGHGGDIELLGNVDVSLPARPDEIEPSHMGENGAVDRPVIVGRRNLADHPERLLGTVRGEGIQSMMGVLAVVRRDIDHPGAVDAVEFGSPVALGVESPLRSGVDAHRLRAANVAQAIGLGYTELVAMPRMAVVVDALVIEDPGIGMGGGSDGVDKRRHRQSSFRYMA